MTQKTALILSVVLTAFLLVTGGAVIARVSQPEAAPVAAPVAAAAPTAAVASDVTAQVQELVAQREAQYRQLIDQANQRLTDMNKQLAAVQAAQPAAPARVSAPAAPAPAQPAAPQIALSPDAARNIAIQASNFATMIRTPELVRFEGKVAYEVGFTRGAVYVDATTGAVLFNGTQVAAPPAANDDHGGEHDDHDDDRDDDRDDDHDDDRDDDHGDDHD
jgi:hypothetical protein